MSNRIKNCVLILAVITGSLDGFSIGLKKSAIVHRCRSDLFLSSSSSSPSQSSATATPPIDVKKEAVKIFGRLAEKYIMLDASAGKCCYSGCKDCEFRLPGGGYRMADQSSARPKWIPNYSVREANGNRHETKWSIGLFPDEKEKVCMNQFVERIRDIVYAPPLGGPSVSASDAAIDDIEAAKALFVILAGDEDQLLTKKQFGKRIKELAGGEEGLTWAAFQAALGL
jgi:hypothetical protein